MPDRRRHRGAHPRDPILFAPDQLDRLRSAVADYSWLLTRDYAPDSALALVGNRYQLAQRQRLAVSRAACSDVARVERRRRRRTDGEVAGSCVGVDGFNCCITLEAALSGGPLLFSRDTAHRDLSSVHGGYRRVMETPHALDLLVEGLHRRSPDRVVWYFDRAVSNSGALAGFLRQRLRARAIAWNVELADNPDRELVRPGCVAATSDSWVLDRATAWFDLAGEVIRERVPDAWVLDLSNVG